MPRKYERAGIIREIVLESSAGKRQSRISDMSMGGCYIESITKYRQGEEVFFDLESTSEDVLRFAGRVAYVLEGFGFGLTFTDLTPDHLTFLSQTLPVDPRPAAENGASLLEHS